ncbi:prolyl-tRNA synthetase associated domain-containing protein [Chitinophaga silvatica]|uniref:Prolyl-tRNA synthetase associated domain-containing protein n=1 Tax=Chitinophaga silvatica TaxID=2282649 RepID=A0A3E1YHU2_9BACT|nr:YbaK/EbsC family protein [Chitinophaga silvatica]RFS26918.1 prolyl-tRNA synthetase associated domain-containing protein [Chitinophaga silvatica]
MFYLSEVKDTAPSEFMTPLQEMVYNTLQQFGIAFERVDTAPAITMEDCKRIDDKLDMRTVKTLLLCNRQQTKFYLYITTAEKPFITKDLSSALDIPRVSFASVELLQNILGTPVGAATIFGVLLDKENKVEVVVDKDVLQEKWYGCSDGTTTSYMKVSTDWIINDFLAHANHSPKIIEI